MKQLLAIQENTRQIPTTVKAFVRKAATIFVVWKLLYHLVLVPYRFPDKYLTTLTVHSSALLYNGLSGSTVEVTEGAAIPGVYSSFILYIDGQRTVGVADGCNGLELHILYVGFLLCIPGTLPKKAAYILLGLTAIYILNTLRCVGIAWLNLHHVSLADFAHHYFFKIIIYAAVFFTWVKYSKNYFSNA